MKKFASIFCASILAISLAKAQTVLYTNNAQIVTTAGTEIVIEGGAEFQTGSLVNNNGTITLRPNALGGSSNWTNNATATFLSGTGLVNMRSNANQTISGNNTFYNLRCDNGAKVIYTGTTPLTVTNQLMLDGSTKLQMPTSVSVEVTNPAVGAITTDFAAGFLDRFNPNYVLGRLVRATNTTASEYVFPIGKQRAMDNFYAPARFTRSTAAGPVSYYAEYFFVQPTDRLNFDNPPIEVVSGVEYWNISPTTADFPLDDDINLTLSYRDSSYINSSAAIRDELLITNYSDRGLGNKWNAEGLPANYSTVTGNANFGWVAANAASATYVTDLFTLASRSKFNPLPVSTINWDVSVDGNTAYPYWNVFNETNVVKYIVERSLDNQTFTQLTTVNSGRLSANNAYRVQDPEFLTQCVYYKLKLVDDRGRIYEMPTKKVCGGRADYSFKLYPNPAHQQIYLQTPVNVGGYKIVITDATGRTIAVKNTTSSVTQAINIGNFASGTYHIQVIENNKIVFKKLFIKE